MSDVLAGRRIPFLRHARVELRKQLDTRAGLWILIAIALITIGGAVLPLWILEPDGLTWRAFIDFSSGGWGILLPFVGVMAATSEWSQRTGLTTFALEPRRTLVNIAKLASALLLGAVLVAASFAAAAAVNLIGIAAFGGDGSWTLDAGYVLGQVATLTIYVALGVGVGLALLSTPLAIVAFIVLPLAVSVLAMIPALADLVPWLDLSGATLPLVSGSMSGEDWAQLGTVVALWCLAPLGFGLWRTARREVA
ncbi:ABC transporter permease [Microbacterium halophytorum]|uniref:ABC transporter permease n=1 Tax=Microbacterium halophytorum TaxID=2067568 RepID=UPI000CFBAC66|nr:ABC transporter permease [Microbacterium halophytorum]